MASLKANFKKILKWTGIAVGSLVGLLILVIVLTSIFGGDDNDSQTDVSRAKATPVSRTAGATSAPATPRPTATRRPTPTPITVTANALERQHEANEVLWEDKYVGKYILITGSISSITEAGAQYNVKLNTDNLWVNIVCKVSSNNRSDILELATGETITVYGLVTSAGIIDIVVKDCTVKAPESVQASGQEQSSTATLASTLSPQPTSAPQADPTPDPFTQYQGAAKKVATLTVYVGTPTGSGSGFLYRLDDSEEFTILTNSHVVQDYSSVEICWALTQRCAYATVKDRGSEDFDLAVIKIPQTLKHGETFQWFANWFDGNIAELKESGNGSWDKGDVVYASGYPGGHKVQGTDIISDPVVTEGIIAIDALAAYRNAYFIEHGADIEPGSSGGPLMNSASSIIGINTGTNPIAEQLELAIPMASVAEWLATGEEPSLIRTPRLLPEATSETPSTPPDQNSTSDPTATSHPTPASTPTPTPTSTPTPTPRPTPKPKVGTRGNPIPLGAVTSYPEWEVSVISFTPNANNLIASSSPYNDLPDTGHVYVMVKVRGKYTGTSVGKMRYDLDYYMVGDSNTLYEPRRVATYHVLHEHPDILRNGMATGNLAFMVPSDEVSSLLLVISDGSLRYSDSTVGYFSLD